MKEESKSDESPERSMTPPSHDPGDSDAPDSARNKRPRGLAKEKMSGSSDDDLFTVGRGNPQSPSAS